MALIFIIAFAVRYISIEKVGIVYDEPTYVKSGLGYAKTIMNGHLSHDAFAYNYEHPPVGKYLYGFAEYFLNSKQYDYNSFLLSRMVSMACGAFTCVIVYLFARRYFNEGVGLLAALTLALTPAFIAYTMVAALDSPLVLFLTAAVYVFALAIEQPSKWLYLLSAIMFGLALSTKFSALLTLPVLAVFFILERREKFMAKPADYLLGAAAWLGIVVILFIVVWPLLWSNPIGELSHSLNHWTYTPSQWFLGDKPTPPIPHYYPVYFAVTTPEILLPLVIVGAGLLLFCKERARWLVLLWATVPFAWGFTSLVQDNMRYLLMIYPAVAVICAYAVYRIAVKMGELLKTKDEKLPFIAVSGVVLISLLLTCMAAQPMYLNFYNSLAGSQKSISDDNMYLQSWWGEGLRAPIDYVESVSVNKTVAVMDYHCWDSTAFFMCADNNHYQYINGTNYRNSWLRNSTYDYLIIATSVERRQNVTPEKCNYKLVYTESLDNQPIYEVYKHQRGL